MTELGDLRQDIGRLEGKLDNLATKDTLIRTVNEAVDRGVGAHEKRCHDSRAPKSKSKVDWPTIIKYGLIVAATAGAAFGGGQFGAM
jgi:hypothetical protein